MKYVYLYTRIATYSGFGGPAKPDYSDPKHSATPTRSGRFTVNFIGPHATLQTGEGARVWSAVPYGTPMRLTKEQVVQIKLPGQDWQRLTKLPAWQRFDGSQRLVYESVVKQNLLLWTPVLKAYDEVPQGIPIKFYHEVPDKWIFNDFGHVTVKYYRDVNNNSQQDRTEAERTLSDFIHTVPSQELFASLNAQAQAGLSAPLTESHGCVHTFPAEIDEMIRSGYLRVGSTFVVHSYTDSIKGVFEETSSVLRTATREAHFFPKEKKIIVYMVTKLN